MSVSLKPVTKIKDRKPLLVSSWLKLLDIKPKKNLPPTSDNAASSIDIKACSKDE